MARPTGSLGDPATHRKTTMPPAHPAHIDVAVIGAGVMGSRHARIVSEHPRTRLVAVLDQDLDAARRLSTQHGCRAAVDPDLRRFDAVIVATAPDGHAAWAERAIAAAVPVLVEKPMAPDIGQVRSALDAAEKGGVPIMCGFLERHHPAVIAGLERLDTPTRLGSIRHSPPDVRVRVGVVHDLVIHDLDHACRLASHPDPVGIVATTGGPVDGVDRVAEARLTFDDGFVAEMAASQSAPSKHRTLLIEDETRTIEIDTVSPRVLEHEGGRTELVDTGGGPEPLRGQLDHFVALIEGRVDLDTERASIGPPHELVARVEAEAGLVGAP